MYTAKKPFTQVDVEEQDREILRRLAEKSDKRISVIIHEFCKTCEKILAAYNDPEKISLLIDRPYNDEKTGVIYLAPLYIGRIEQVPVSMSNEDVEKLKDKVLLEKMGKAEEKKDAKSE